MMSSVGGSASVMTTSRSRPEHNGGVPERLSGLITRLGLRRADLVLALVFTVAAITWVLSQRHFQHVPGPFESHSEFSAGPQRPASPQPTDDAGFGQGVTDGVDYRGGIILNIVATLPLAIRRRLPNTAMIVGFSGVLLLATTWHNAEVSWPGFLALMIVSYSAVVYGRHLAGSFAFLLAAVTVAAVHVDSSTPPIPGWLGLYAIIGSVALAAAAIRSTRARADVAAQRAESLEREKEASTRAAIAEERARVARELHDVVSHHVSVMVIQAGAAGKVIDSRPDLASGAMQAVESSGREAMRELRHLLGVVAPVDDRLHPLPGLESLDMLIGTVRAAGQPVTLNQQTGTVPREVHLTIYRVVQEGLTNALRYAPGAPTAVTLSREGDHLVVEVCNDRPQNPRTDLHAERGPAIPPDVPAKNSSRALSFVRAGALTGVGAGAGLIGLAERLRLHQGTLDAGKRLGGGFRVTARIPLPPFDPISPPSEPA